MVGFDNIILFTLNYEKYRSDNKKDPGGLTIWGIASKYHPVEVAKMLKMSVEDAKVEAIKIYYNEYWFGGSCNKLPSITARAHFDSCVNPGVGAAVRFIQKVVGVKEDGDFGKITKCAVDNYLKLFTDESLAKKIIELRDQYYTDKHNVDFGKGWHNRVVDLKKFLNIA